MVRYTRAKIDAILRLLSKKMCVEEVAKILGISRQTASRYLRYLYNKGLLKRGKIGRKKYYWKK